VESPFLTGLGLAGPAGLNAYIPLLVLAIADRFTNQINLTQPYDFISSTWGILIILLLLTIEVVVDKIPGFDHANDLLQSVIRPATGAVMIMAVTNEQGVINPVVAMFLGLGTAGAVHAVKTVSRPAVTVSTAGAGNPIVSLIEDGVAIFASIMAILLPIVAVITFVVLAIFVYWSYSRVRRLVGRQRQTGSTTASGT
jgi:hypothetical protein